MKNRINYANKYNEHTPNLDIEDSKEVVDPEPELESIEPKFLKVAVDRLNLRPYNSTNGDPIKELHKGEELMITDEVDGWYHVMTASGAEGYVVKKYVE